MTTLPPPRLPHEHSHLHQPILTLSPHPVTRLQQLKSVTQSNTRLLLIMHGPAVTIPRLPMMGVLIPSMATILPLVLGHTMPTPTTLQNTLSRVGTTFKTTRVDRMPLIIAILTNLPMVQVGHILALTDMVLHTHITQLTATMQVRT